MHLERVKVDSYGPLRDVDHELDEGFTLFHGYNESGKTLYVESLVKMLLDAEAEGFRGIGRVQGMPAGFLEIEASDGRLQLPDAELEEIFPEPVTARDVRNTFVIRDVDLRRPERKPDFGRTDYLRDVTDRVLGARTGEIQRLQDEIAEIGDLTPSYERLRDRKPEKLKSRVEEARELVDDLEGYVERSRRRGVMEKVDGLRRKRERIEETEEEIRVLEVARENRKLETARERVQELQKVEDDIEEHEDESDRVEELRDLRREIEMYRERRSQRDFDPDLLLNVLAALGLLFALSLLAAVLSPVTGILVISGVVLAALLYVGQRYMESRELVGEEDRLVQEANYSGVSGSSLPEVYIEVEEEIRGFEEELEWLRGERERLVGRLQESFDADHSSSDGWMEEVESRMEAVEDVDRDYEEGMLEEARNRLQVLGSEVEEMERELEEHGERLREFDRRVRDVAPENYLDDVDDVGVDSAADLSVARDVVESFVDEVEGRRDAARQAVEVLEEIEQEEEEEIDELFSGDGYLRSTFQEVTDDSYVDVSYDEEAGEVLVERVDGRLLSVDELSQGTYDLLYLLVRLKLSRELSGGEPGFLLLDSPFVHSDVERVGREIQLLQRLVEDGWQVLYFSFRDVVRDAVEQHADAEVVDLDRLDFTG